MTRLELLNHLELSERYSLLRSCSIEPNPVAVARLIETLKLIENDAEHGKGIQLLVDLLQLFADDHNLVLDTEEAVSHDYIAEKEARC